MTVFNHHSFPHHTEHPEAPRLFMGQMSGTSMDGVDTVIASFDNDVIQCVHLGHLPMSAALRHELIELNSVDGNNELHRASVVSLKLANWYADAARCALKDTGLVSAQITALACHGQTIRHQPAHGYTLQLNAPALLAEKTGIAVVADFRSRDLAAGGQGAPLVPAFHAHVFRHESISRVILNIGGFANVTILPPKASSEAVLGFDTGTGNVLLDAWIHRHQGLAYDADGAWAASGKRLPELLTRLLKHDFFERDAPKSTGRDDFHLAWLESHLTGHEEPADVQATLLALSAQTIAKAILSYATVNASVACHLPREVYLCGGGVYNLALCDALRQALPSFSVQSIATLGVEPMAVEALAFAWLGHRFYHGLAGNFPAVTGARGERILGAWYPA